MSARNYLKPVSFHKYFRLEYTRKFADCLVLLKFCKGEARQQHAVDILLIYKILSQFAADLYKYAYLCKNTVR